MRGPVLAFFLLLPLIAAASIQYSVEDQTTCSCDLATFSVVAENTGDTLESEVLHAQSSTKVEPQNADVDLKPGEKKKFQFFAQSPCGSARSVPVSFRTKTVQMEAILYGKSCDGFTLSVTPEQTACPNQFAQFSVTLTNTGRSAQDILLSSDLNPEGASLIDRIVIPAYESKNVFLTVNTPAAPQRLPFKVFAESLGVKMEQPAILTVQSCQGIGFTGQERVVLTQGGSANITLLIRNIGGSRTVRIDAFCPAFVSSKNVTLTLNASQTIPYSFHVNATSSGTYPCSIFASPSDESRNYLKTVLLEIRPKKEAHNAFDVTPRTFFVEKGLEKKLVFTLRSDENRTVNARLRLEGADVLTLSQTAHLEEGTPENLTFSIRAKTQGLYNGTLIFENQTFPFTLNVAAPSLVIEGTAYKTGPDTYRVDFAATNFGNATRADIFTQPPSVGPAFLDLPQNIQGRFSLTVNTNGTKPLYVSLKTNRGDYAHVQSLSDANPLPQTGFVTLSTPVLAFSAAVLLALGILYLFYRRSRL